MVGLLSLSGSCCKLRAVEAARSRGKELKVASETVREYVHFHEGFQPKGGVQAFKREHTFVLLKMLLQPAEPMPTIRDGHEKMWMP